MLTKLELAALRQCDALCVHLSKDFTAVRAIKRNPKTEKEPFAQDQEQLITADVGLETLRGREELESGRVKCFAHISLYPNQKHTSWLILQTLRVGDELTFNFYPDAHTNGYIAAAGLHGDALYLNVRRKGKTVARWSLAHSICPTNTARMVTGVPDSESYTRDAERVRKSA